MCRDELERLARETIFSNDVAIYFVNSGERLAVVKRFADYKKFNSHFRKKIVLDPQYFIAETFSVNVVPTYIFFKDKKPVFRSFYLDQELIHSVFEK